MRSPPDPDEKRWKSVSVRVTQADYDRLLRLAKAHDLPVSIYLMQLWRELDGEPPGLISPSLLFRPTQSG